MNETMIVGSLQTAEPVSGSVAPGRGLTGSLSGTAGISGSVAAEAHLSGDLSADTHLSGEVTPTGEVGGNLSAAYGTPGRDGNDGITPHIGENRNWFIGDTDTGVSATGKEGKPGRDGYTPVKGVDYFDGLPGKDGEPGQDGKDADVYTAVWSNAWTKPPKGTWEITLYKNGTVCEDAVYAEFLYATSLSDEPTKESSHTGDFTGSLSWSATAPYKYLINFYEDNTKAKLLHSEMLAPNAFDKSALVDLLHPVGSVFITSNNENPGDTLGGTWELIGKRFKDASGSGTTTHITYNEDNTTSCTVYYTRSGNNLRLKFALKVKVAVAETNLTFGTLALSKLGVSALGSVNYTSVPFGGEAGIILCSLTTAGKLTNTDVVIKGSTTSIAAESTVYGEICCVLKADNMLDSACDQFYWKRTA